MNYRKVQKHIKEYVKTEQSVSKCKKRQQSVNKYKKNVKYVRNSVSNYIFITLTLFLPFPTLTKTIYYIFDFC